MGISVCRIGLPMKILNFNSVAAFENAFQNR